MYSAHGLPFLYRVIACSIAIIAPTVATTTDVCSLADSKGSCNMTVRPLLYTGFGASVDKERFRTMSPHEIKMLLRDKGVILVEGLNYSKEDFRQLLKSIGKLVNYDPKQGIGDGYQDFITLEGEDNKVVQGRGELPLHVDGALLGTRVDIVYLYALEINGLKFQGATSVCDHKLALEELPPHLKRVLLTEKFEAIVYERGYFKDVSPPDWFEIPMFEDYGWIKKLFLYIPFAKDQPASWHSRVVGFSAAESAAFFDELKAFMIQPRYYYKHYWRTGDLLIMDNRRVLHSRDPFSKDIVRKLYRGQTLDSHNE